MYAEGDYGRLLSALVPRVNSVTGPFSLPPFNLSFPMKLRERGTLKCGTEEGATRCYYFDRLTMKKSIGKVPLHSPSR